MAYPSNALHPVDRLHQVRQQLRELEAEEKELRADLLLPGASLAGEEFVAHVADWHQTRVDKSALVRELGPAAARFMRKLCVKVVKLRARHG